MPGEWREIRLGDLVARGELAISDGYRVRNEELGPEGIPFVRGGDIGDGWINTSTVDHIRPELAERVRAKLAYAGDVAFITKGTVGRSGRLRPGQPAVVFAPQVAYWRVLSPESLDSGFLFYLIRSREFQSALNGVKTHGSMVADYVSISQQHDFAFRFPDIESQRAIALVLGTLDDKVALNRGMNETLEAMARAFFKSWFVDFDPVRQKAEAREAVLPKSLASLFPDSFEDSEIGQIPTGWAVRGLDAIASFLNGLALQKYPPTGPQSLPVIKIAQLRKGDTLGADLASADIPDDYVVKDGDVLFSWSGSLECDLWSGGTGALNQHLFKVTSEEYPKWFYYFSIHEHLEAFRHIAAGKATTMGHIQRHHLSDAKAAVPPRSLVAAANTFLSPMLDRIIKTRIESRSLADLRDALLPKLISGELQIKDAEGLLRRQA